MLPGMWNALVRGMKMGTENMMMGVAFFGSLGRNEIRSSGTRNDFRIINTCL